MKISPMAAPNAPANMEVGQSAGTDRMARAKAVMQGISPDTVTAKPAEVEQNTLQNQIKRIKLNTQRSVYRDFTPPGPEAPVQSDILNTDDSPKELPVSDETKPLSPQIAALARAKRALQLREQAIAAKEKQMTTQQDTARGTDELIQSLKTNPLRVLQEHGVTYDQLTEAVLNQNAGNAGIEELRAELKSMKEGIEKAQAERDTAQEQQVMRQIKSDVNSLVANGEEYASIRFNNAQQTVVDVMSRHFRETGELLDMETAARAVEAYFEPTVAQRLQEFSKLNKFQAKTREAQSTQARQAPTQTLTNRDGAMPAMSPRERAMAAFWNKLK